MNASLPTASGIHTAPYPSSSSSPTCSAAWLDGTMSSVKVQIPYRPMSIRHVPCRRRGGRCRRSLPNAARANRIASEPHVAAAPSSVRCRPSNDRPCGAPGRSGDAACLRAVVSSSLRRRSLRRRIPRSLMTAHVRTITFDCRDPYPLARFWSAVLGYTDHPDNPNDPDDPEALIVDPRGLSARAAVHPRPRAQDREEPRARRPPARRRAGRDGRARAGARRLGRRRPPHARRQRLGRHGRPRGQRAVHRALGRRAARAEASRRDTGVRASDARTADERSMLDGDARLVPRRHHRQGRGREPVARRRPGRWRTATSIGGLVKHLTLVEELVPRTTSPGARRARRGPAPGRPTRLGVPTARDEPIEDLVAAYVAACERSRAAATGHGLDDLGANPGAIRRSPSATCTST